MSASKVFLDTLKAPGHYLRFFRYFFRIQQSINIPVPHREGSSLKLLELRQLLKAGVKLLILKLRYLYIKVKYNLKLN